MPLLPASSRLRRPRWSITIIAAALAVVLALNGAVLAASSGSWGSERVGSDDGQGILLPDQQRLTPVGTRHLVNGGRLLSSALSPDGTKLAALTAVVTRGYLTVMDV